MSAPVALRSNYSHLYGSSMLPALDELFRSEYEQHPSRRELLFRSRKVDRDITQYSELHDLELHAEIGEGQEYTYKRMKQGYSKTATVLKYGLGISISEEAIDDGKIDLVADMVRKMGRSAKESKEVNAMNILNNAFTGSTVLTADGQNLCDTDHALPSGGTYRNELTTAADLSVTSLETALYDFETQFVGDSGIIEMIKPKFLVVNPLNRRYADELVNSMGKADTADNNKNSFKDEGLIVISTPHLVDTDAWFLIADPSQNGLRIANRADIETKAEEDFDTDSIKYKSRYREVVYAVHGKGVFGTPGA